MVQYRLRVLQVIRKGNILEVNRQVVNISIVVRPHHFRGIQQISNLQFQSIEENQVLDLLPAFCRDDADEIMACINEFKSKQGINNALVKQFGNKKGSEIYRAIKGLLKN